MPQNNNTDVTKELRDGLKINQAYESVPNEVGKTIVPVFVSNPQKINNIVVYSTRSTNGTTSYTVPSNKDFYLTSVELNLIKDSTSDMANLMRMSLTINGLSASICQIPTITLTAQEQTRIRHFNPPIKIDRGTNMSYVVSTSVGINIATASIVGYTVEF